MPFTLSHSAAVLPLVRSRYLSATGLIIGTMAPDFEYFIRMGVKGIYGHTVLGVFYFDLPVAIVLAFLFHYAVKKNLIDNLPVFLQARFQDVRSSDFLRYVKTHKLDFVISIIIGTTTHILWDGFTHQGQFFVEAFPVIYKDTTVPFMGVKYPLWYALQNISTVAGGLILVIYVLRIQPTAGDFNKPRISYWLILIAIIAAIVAVRVQGKIESQKYVVIVITIVSAFCIGITILGLIPFFRRRET